jgi:hypothetical protein
MKSIRCGYCNMLKSEWTRNDGNGVSREGIPYCCTGCAQNKRCTCKSGVITKDTKGRTPAPVTNPK